MRTSTMFLIGAGIFLSMGTAQNAYAGTTSKAYVKFAIQDQFQNPIMHTPQIMVSNCVVSEIGTTSPVANMPGIFKTELIFPFNATRQGCMLSVHARGFVGGKNVSLRSLAENETLDISNIPFELWYSLNVELFDDAGREVTNNASIEFGGITPNIIRGNSYYFAATGTSELQLFHPGLLFREQKQVVSAGIANPTKVIFQNAIQCASKIEAGMTAKCHAPSSNVSIVVREKFGTLIPDATINIFTNLERTLYATDLSSGLASKSMSGTGIQLSLPPGKYYITVSKPAYNDYIGSFIVSPRQASSQSIVLLLATSDLVSPQLSTASVDTRVVADGNSVAIVSLRAMSGTNVAMKERTIEVFSSRGAHDTILLPSQVTSDTGGGVIYITSTKSGISFLTVKLGGVVLSVNPKIIFDEPTQGVGSAIASPARTSLSITPSPIRGDGKEQVTITVVVRNELGSRLSGKKVLVSSTRIGDTLTLVGKGISNEEGSVEYTFSSVNAGTSIMSATVDEVKIKEEQAITVSPIVE